MNLHGNKTKIVATIGPASDSPAIMEALLLAGMNVARLNFSHGSFDNHARVIEKLRAAASKVGQPLAIMADLPGPKIRIGEMAAPVELKRGDHITLTTDDIIGNGRRVSVNLEALPGIVHAGDRLFLNDGMISLEVLETNEREVHCRVHAGGELSSRKGLNLPGIDLGFGAFTDHDRECLEFALAHDVDAVSQSFISRAEDVVALREAMVATGKRAFVVAKIERREALDHLEEILEVSDGLMIARGDLGVEIPISGIAVVQKQLMKRANRLGKPVITATQMLESMIVHRRPTRAEATDVANAILDGTDAVMLSAESAIGRYPVQAVNMLVKIAVDTEPEKPAVIVRRSDVEEGSVEPVDLIAHCVQQAVYALKPAAVVVPTRSGCTARNIARYRLQTWITAFSTEHFTCQALQFSWGVNPVQVDQEYRDWTPYSRQWLHAQGCDAGVALLTQGPSPDNPDASHSMEIVYLK